MSNKEKNSPKTDKTNMWKFRFFTIWKEEKEEEWLRSMSKQGWHLYKIVFLFYFFQKGEPVDYVYKFDFKAFERTAEDEYLTQFDESGWEYVDSLGAWYYFRTKAEGRADVELYSSQEKKIGKYKRVLKLLLILFGPCIWLPVIPFATNRIVSYPGWLQVAIFGFFIPMFLLYVVSIIAVQRKIKRLEKQPA